jgi:hypothetical protein
MHKKIFKIYILLLCSHFKAFCPPKIEKDQQASDNFYASRGTQIEKDQQTSDNSYASRGTQIEKDQQEEEQKRVEKVLKNAYFLSMVTYGSSHPYESIQSGINYALRKNYDLIQSQYKDKEYDSKEIVFFAYMQYLKALCNKNPPNFIPTDRDRNDLRFASIPERFAEKNIAEYVFSKQKTNKDISPQEIIMSDNEDMRNNKFDIKITELDSDLQQNLNKFLTNFKKIALETLKDPAALNDDIFIDSEKIKQKLKFDDKDANMLITFIEKLSQAYQQEIESQYITDFIWFLGNEEKFNLKDIMLPHYKTAITEALSIKNSNTAPSSIKIPLLKNLNEPDNTEKRKITDKNEQ